jgi:6-methylsalicylate decarboxylase
MGRNTLRIDTHHHLIPPDYRQALRKAGIDEAGGRALPEWSSEAALQAMADLEVSTAILSVSTPGTTFLPNPADAAALARDLNDYTAELVASAPDRFGFFATVAMPHVDAAVTEAVRALDALKADGVVLLANNAGTYLGQEGQDELFAALNERSAVVFVHPADLPGPIVPGVAPFAADFLLDTTRAAYLLVRNGVRRTYPNIRFILSHAGGFVPYASHRMAVAITGDTGRSPADSLDDFAGFYFDTALSSSAAALPSLLAFAKPGHITFGSDWPFAPVAAGKLFAAGLETFSGIGAATRDAIDRTNALALFPRLGTARKPAPRSRVDAARHAASRMVMRGVARLINTS